jgi:hypothetical protein
MELACNPIIEPKGSKAREMLSLSLYRRILGPQFDELPGVLQRFHDAPGGGSARGQLTVERGRGRLANVVASLLGMPKAGRDIPVQLTVQVHGDRERWVRHFGDHRLESIAWERGGLLMEGLGLSSFSSRLVVEGARLRYDFRRAFLAGVPLPRRLAPFVRSWVEAGERGWHVVVHIVAPLVGELVSYEGWIEPE